MPLNVWAYRVRRFTTNSRSSVPWYEAVSLSFLHLIIGVAPAGLGWTSRICVDVRLEMDGSVRMRLVVRHRFGDVVASSIFFTRSSEILPGLFA